MAATESYVQLSIAGYNQIKSENTKAVMFMDRIFDETVISEDGNSLIVDKKLLDDLLRLCYTERYKKRLSYLRGLQTKEMANKLKEEKVNDEKKTVSN